jgi:hypothetical protein
MDADKSGLQERPSQFGIALNSDRLAIVKELASFRLPVHSVEQMEQESVLAVESIP